MISNQIYSSRLICNEEIDTLIHHLPKNIYHRLWLGHGGYLKVTEDKTQTVLKQSVGNETLPSICMVYLKGTQSCMCFLNCMFINY